jgi:Type II secretion system (T2SS), protein E, N-terminal domain
LKLGDWLISKGKISEDQLAQALHDQSFFGGRLGNSLIKLGFLDEDALGEYLADVSHSTYAPPGKLEGISPQVIAAVPSRLAARYRIVPIEIVGRKLHLAMRDPKDLIALDEIAFLTGLTIEPYVATEFRIVKAIERYYGIKLETPTIPVSGAQDPARPDRREASRQPQSRSTIAAPPAASRDPEMGLDGLPLDADPAEQDQPFMSGPSGPPAENVPEEPLPASLDEWRQAQQEVPEAFQEQGGAGGPIPPAAPAASQRPAPVTRVVPARAPAATTAASSAGPTLESISGRLKVADTRDDVFNAVLDFAASQFRRAALFVVQQDRVLGWSGRGENLSPLRVRNVTVALDRPSLFVFFRTGGDYFYGPVPDLPANARFYLDMGTPPPARVLMLPLTIKDRPAVILYADDGPESSRLPEIQVYRRLLQKAAMALEVLILRNKIMMI